MTICHRTHRTEGKNPSWVVCERGKGLPLPHTNFSTDSFTIFSTAFPPDFPLIFPPIFSTIFYWVMIWMKKLWLRDFDANPVLVSVLCRNTKTTSRTAPVNSLLWVAPSFLAFFFLPNTIILHHLLAPGHLKVIIVTIAVILTMNIANVIINTFVGASFWSSPKRGQWRLQEWREVCLSCGCGSSQGWTLLPAQAEIIFNSQGALSSTTNKQMTLCDKYTL